MKTRERYIFHKEKLKEYQKDFYELVQDLDITELKKLRLETLFECYGYSRTMQSKEYQQLKKENE